MLSKSIKKQFLFFVSLFCALIVAAFPEVALAAVQKPSFVESASASDIETAGGAIYGWITVAFGVVVALAIGIASMMGVSGKMEEMWERLKGVIIGFLIFVIGGGLVFALV